MIKQKEQDIFIVSSHTSNKQYEVNLKNMSCSCPHYSFRLIKSGGVCKHYLDVLKYLEEKTTSNTKIFDKIETFIREKNNSVSYNELIEKFGENILEQMINLGLLYKQKRDRLGVL